MTQVTQGTHMMQDNQDNQVRLAHLWIEFRVIFSFLEHVFCPYPALCFQYDKKIVFKRYLVEEKLVTPIITDA